MPGCQSWETAITFPEKLISPQFFETSLVCNQGYMHRFRISLYNTVISFKFISKNICNYYKEAFNV